MKVQNTGAIDLLPDCRLRDESKGEITIRGLQFIPTYCANCKAGGPWVTKATCTFQFWLCDNCFEKWGPIAGTMVIPDEVVMQKVAEEIAAQKLTTPEAIIKAVEDTSNPLYKLAKEMPKGR